MIARRRFLLTSLTGACALPVVTRAQPARLPLVAILQSTSASAPPGGIPHFKRALADRGWIEGRTIRFEMRYGDWQADRITAAAHELVRLQPDVLYTNSAPAVRALMQATASIPIVVGAVSDLVALGLVKSLARPGGNVTGVTHAQAELDRKRLEVLKETAPAVTRMAYLFDPEAVADVALLALQESARQLNVRIVRVEARTPGQIEAAFALMIKESAQAVLVQDAVLFARHLDRITGLALKYRLPAISQSPQFAERGGLLQYGADVWGMFRRSAVHVDKILRGAKPGDLPVEQPTSVALVINLKTANSLGLTIPPSLLARADPVIE
jgi:putative tryptophan/tyrosine transport system substrate-binding protein